MQVPEVKAYNNTMNNTIKDTMNNRDSSLTSPALLYMTNDYGSGLAGAFETAWGTDNLCTKIGYDPETTTDFTSAVQSVIDAGCDSAVLISYAADGESVEQVDPARYLGLWYEIATTPSRQQASCSGTMAEYSLIDDETIGVTNRCYAGGLNGRLNEIQATARPLDDTFARLMVDFGFGFEAPYTVIELFEPPGDEPYTYAAVTTSDVQYWILSRSPQMDDEMYETLLDKIAERGGDPSRLIMTAQPELTDESTAD